MFKLPVVGCSVLYVLRLAGGPEGNMPSTFGWITSVETHKPETKITTQVRFNISMTFL